MVTLENCYSQICGLKIKTRVAKSLYRAFTAAVQWTYCHLETLILRENK